MSGMPINSSLLDWIVLSSKAEAARETTHGRKWTEEEDQYLRDHLGWLTDDEMGAELGRSRLGVHLRWSRDLHLPSPSKAPDVITANRAAEMLGIDVHKTAGWVDMGLIPGRVMPAGRKIRLINRVSFMVWACSPKNWVYFNPKKVKDLHLKRLLQLKQKRWADEWWTTAQVFKYHGMDALAVNMYVHKGWLKSFCSPVSYGGRHYDRVWSFHYFLKSEVTHKDFYFRHRGEPPRSVTPGALKWIKKALRMGWTCAAIGRSMKRDSETIRNWIKNYVAR